VFRVAFQGERGAYSEEAVGLLWPGAEPVPQRECMDVARAVEAGGVDAGVLAVENTLAGSIAATYDAIVACGSLVATGETTLEIHHCLLAPPGASLAEVEWVESHPAALAQCTELFRRHPHLRARPAYDTAGAAREVAAGADRRRAALASRLAAARYGLDVLLADVEDRPDNRTRFLAVARAPVRAQEGAAARTVLIVTTANEPGALLRVLSPIADLGLNLSKLESRPTGEPWTYRFIVEVEHTAGDPRVPRVVEMVREVTRTCRLVGTYAVGGPIGRPGD
jgi:prephenate dehydratase